MGIPAPRYVNDHHITASRDSQSIVSRDNTIDDISRDDRAAIVEITSRNGNAHTLIAYSCVLLMSRTVATNTTFVRER